MHAADLEHLNDYIITINNDYLYNKDPFMPGRFHLDTFTEVTTQMINNNLHEITFTLHDDYFKCTKEFNATFTVERGHENHEQKQEIKSNLKHKLQELIKNRV